MLRPFYVMQQFALPLVYDDSLSNYETMSKLIYNFNELVKCYNETAGQVNINTEDIAKMKVLIADIQTELAKIANGEYMDIYIEALAKWIDRNLQEIVAKITKQVFFNLDLNGYFVAYIPESWSDITFDTIMTCGDPNWGRLVLKY